MSALLSLGLIDKSDSNGEDQIVALLVMMFRWNTDLKQFVTTECSFPLVFTSHSSADSLMWVFLGVGFALQTEL